MPLDSGYGTYLIFKDREGRIFVSRCYNARITQRMGEIFTLGTIGSPITEFEANLDYIKCLQRDEIQVFDLTEDEIMNIFEEE